MIRAIPFFFFIMAFPIVLVLITIWVSHVRMRAQQRFWASMPPLSEPLGRFPDCPRCQGRMVKGFVPSPIQSYHYTGLWLEGDAGRCAWGDPLRPRLERGVPITTFRCERCGYLEHYARPELVEGPGEVNAKVKESTFREL